MSKFSKIAVALATAALIASPFVVSAQGTAPLTPQMRTLIQTEIALLLLQLQQLQQQLAALESQTLPIVVNPNAATTTPGTAPVSASTTPSTAVLQPTVTVNVNGTSFTRGQPMTVTWSTNVPFGIDQTRLPYLEFFPYGANPIIVPSVRAARPAIGSNSFVWFVSPIGVLGDTLTSGKYIVQIGLYDPALQRYVVGGTALPVTISL